MIESLAIPYTDQAEDAAEMRRYVKQYHARMADFAFVGQPEWDQRQRDAMSILSHAVDGVVMRRASKDGCFPSEMFRVPLRWEME